MTSTNRIAWCALWLLILIPAVSGAEPGAAIARTYKTMIRTYPFSDPNPIPVVDRINPYFRFDGYTDTPVDYETRAGAFGARIVVGVLDLPTRTPWRLEITPPSDAAYFTTRSTWHNATTIKR